MPEDFFESEVALAAAATAVVFSPRVRGVLRQGFVYGVAGATVVARTVTDAAQTVGSAVAGAMPIGIGRSDDAGASSASRGRTAASRAPNSASSAPASRAPRSTGGRAQEALKLVQKQPGITIGEMAKQMKIQADYLYRLLPQLEKDGKVKKRDKGYHPSES
jgi:hypothetical protein